MRQLEYDSASIYFEEHGSGFPLLLIAPGAMNSIIEMWANATINPLALYQDTFRLIAMDQRNAGRSSGPLEPSDPWGTRLSNRPDLAREDIEKFGHSMWRDDFVVSVSRDFVRACTTPLPVLPGPDRYH